MNPSDQLATRESLTRWLKERIGEYARVPVEDIHVDASLALYGLDSVYALTLSDEIQQHLGVLVAPTIVWDTPTLRELVTVLLASCEAERTRK
jgi:acyl carrier protein